MTVATGEPDDDREKELDRLVAEEVHTLEAAGQLYQFRGERRCRVCRDDTTRVLVDRLLANGMTYRAIKDTLDHSVNLTKADGDKITYDSIYNHRQRHFDVNMPASALTRKIAEQAADAQGQNVVDGPTHIVNYVSFLEGVMARSWENLQGEENPTSIKEGMDAAVKLAEIKRREADVGQLAAKIGELSQIINAVKAETSPEQYARIAARLRGEIGTEQAPMDVEVDSEIEDFDMGGIAANDKEDTIDE